MWHLPPSSALEQWVFWRQTAYFCGFFFPYLCSLRTLRCVIWLWWILSLYKLLFLLLTFQYPKIFPFPCHERTSSRYLPSSLLRENYIKNLLSLSSVCLYSFIDPFSPWWFSGIIDLLQTSWFSFVFTPSTIYSLESVLSFLIFFSLNGCLLNLSSCLLASLGSENNRFLFD